MAADNSSGGGPYGADSARQSNNLLYLLAGLVVFIVVVFGVLYVFGQQLGVQI